MKSKIIDGFLLLGSSLSQNGERNFGMNRPLLQDVFTTQVNVSLIILNLHFLSLQNMHIEIEFMITQKWIDPRLDSDDRTKKLATNGQIWKPKITSMAGEYKEIQNTQFFRGESPSGKILYSEKIVLKTFCTDNFVNFPFDTQYCYIKLSSYRFPLEEVELIWDQIPAEWKFDNKTNGFEVKNVEINSSIENRPTGNFTVLITKISLKRDFSHHIFTTFTLFGLIVCGSYSVFWIHPTHMTFRLSLSLVNLVVLMCMYLNSTHFAFNSTLKASDIFVFTCFIFVFISLCGNIIVDYGMRANAEDNEYDLKKRNFNKQWIKMDLYCIILYPTLFLCTVVLFFIAYKS